MGKRKKDLAYETIKDLILSKQLTDEKYISENSLAKRLDMSRTPVREALLRLQSEGFIDIVPNRGAVISSVSVVEAREIYDMRMAIEEFVVRNISNRLTEKHMKDLNDLIKEQEKACDDNDIEGYLVSDGHFHDYFLELYDNQVILEAVRKVRQRFLAVSLTVITTQADMKTSLGHHKELLQALQDDDYERAARALHEHLRFGKTNLLR